MRILLLNPPGKHLFLRDYYCSTVSKSGYLWHPIDLLIQSGYLERQGDLYALDAIANRLTVKKALEQIQQIRPDVVFSLVGTQSQVDDLKFLRAVTASLPGVRIAVSGEPLLDAPQALLADAPWVTVAVQNFTTPELEQWVKEGAPGTPQLVLGTRLEGHQTDVTFSYPSPNHGLFRSRRYRIPLIDGREYASVISSFGCPFRCTYCNSGKDAIGFATRPLNHLFDEILTIQKMGVNHLFFRDMNFTTPKHRCVEICQWLEKTDNLTFNCYSRPDTLSPTLCNQLKRAGCLLVHMGVETFSEPLLKSQQRPMNPDRIQEAFILLRRYGIKRGAHFVLGLPGQTLESVKETIGRAQDLDPDYVSFNVFQRRSGARRVGQENPSALSNQELFRLCRLANRRFYLRPQYVLGTLQQVRSLGALWDLVLNASSLMKSNLQPSDLDL